MYCALDVGRRLGITPAGLAEEVEAGLVGGPGVLRRAALARVLRQASLPEVEALLAADKKAGTGGELRMVLLRALGRSEVVPVGREIWRALWAGWQGGARP
jgi:3-dehydroquinate synthase